MNILFDALILLGVFFLMEGVAWFTHKYVMHGFLWVLHEDHHKKDHDHPLEKNDTFFLIFAVPSALLIYGGLQTGIHDYKVWIGGGISAYGLAYALVHEIFIHQRLKFFKKADRTYFQAIRRAHKIHHKHLGKEDGECFGMLWVPIKYFKKYKSSN